MYKRSIVFPLLLSIALICSAQVPQKFNYQAVVRNAQHTLLSNQDVGFRMSILKGSANGSPVYVETHTVTTNGVGLADLVIGNGSVASGEFEEIAWGGTDMFLKVEVDPTGGASYEQMGTSQLISVPYALYSGNISSPTRKFTIQEEMGHPVDSALFEVRNAEGQTVFAVYPEGTRVYVLDDGTKGVKRGFAVGGYSRNSKGITQDYMHVSPDSIRIYFDDAATKGVKGGFAVGGYSRDRKGPVDHYFELKPDSAKFLMVSDQPEDLYSGALSVVTKSSVGSAENYSANLFNLTRDNYFIGHRAGEAITTGFQNSFIGFESGENTTEGYGNIFFGMESGRSNTTGVNNVFIGVQSGRWNSTGIFNSCVGYQSGYNLRSGNYNSNLGFLAGHANRGGDLNTYLGAHAGYALENGTRNTYVGAYSGSEDSTGNFNVFVGIRAGSHVGTNNNTMVGALSGGGTSSGEENVFIGHRTGNFCTGSYNTFLGTYVGEVIEGSNNLFLGWKAGSNSRQGSNNVYVGRVSGYNCDGSENIFIGNTAGRDEQGSNRLIIENSSSDSTNCLIWGNFNQDILRLNNRVGIGRHPENEALEVEGDAYKTSGTTAWDVTSDARVKTDIRNIEDGLQQIMSLRPVTYRYTDEWRKSNPGIKDQEYYHFIAQEFAKVFPESVHRGPESIEGESENLLRMNSQPAQVVAIRAIQELAQKSQQLSEKVDSQQAIIEELLLKVSALESKVKAR